MARREKARDLDGLVALGKAIRLRRDTLGISQEELGYKAGLDRTYVSGVERGRRNPTVRVLWRLARALEFKTSTLFQEAERLLAESNSP